jgi:nicotinamide-nucleotide amidase
MSERRSRPSTTAATAAKPADAPAREAAARAGKAAAPAVKAAAPAGKAAAPGARAAGGLRTAELLSIGTELTVGDTRDTNAGELARDIARRGVRVGRITAIPDRLDVVTEAFARGLERADIVISTGGLGPTPDDLTREAIAAAIGETPAVDAELEAWLRELWRRRGMTMPDMNLKQAWLIPSGTAIPNPNGTAPGWWIDAPAGGVIVALPGPPREMRPMWREWVLPRLETRGLGGDFVSRTYRLTGIGESAVADLLGEGVLRRENPEVATYARAEAVDVRVSAFGDHANRAADLVRDAEAAVLEILGKHVWGTADETWADAIGRRMTGRGWTLSTVEVGTGGSLLTLLGDQPWIRFAEVLAGPDVAGLAEHAAQDDEHRLIALANRVRNLGGSDVGVSVEIRDHHADTEVLMGVARPEVERGERTVAFLGGQQGKARAALNAAAFLWRSLPGEDER